MNEELDTLIDQMVDQGATEQEIDAAVASFKGKQGGPPQGGLDELIDSLVDQGASEQEIDQAVAQFKSGGATQPVAEEGGGVGDYLTAGMKGMNKGFYGLVPSTLKTIGAGEEFIGRHLFNEPEGSKGNFTRAGEWTQEKIDQYNPDTENVPEFYKGVTQGVGQGLGMMLTGGLSRGAQGAELAAQGTEAATLGGALRETGKEILGHVKAPTGFIGGAMAAAPEWEEAKAAGLSDDDAMVVMLKNYAIGQTEVLPLENLMKFLNNATKGGVVDILKTMGTQGVSEAMQEAMQTYLTNKVAQGSYDPDRDPMLGLAESAGMGAIVGALLPGVMGGLLYQRKSKKSQEIVDEAGDTGDPAINAKITQDGTLSPSETVIQAKKNEAEEAEEKEEKLAEDDQAAFDEYGDSFKEQEAEGTVADNVGRTVYQNGVPGTLSVQDGVVVHKSGEQVTKIDDPNKFIAEFGLTTKVPTTDPSRQLAQTTTQPTTETAPQTAPAKPQGPISRNATLNGRSVTLLDHATDKQGRKIVRYRNSNGTVGRIIGPNAEAFSTQLSEAKKQEKKSAPTEKANIKNVTELLAAKEKLNREQDDYESMLLDEAQGKLRDTDSFVVTTADGDVLVQKKTSKEGKPTYKITDSKDKPVRKAKVMAEAVAGYESQRQELESNLLQKATEEGQRNRDKKDAFIETMEARIKKNNEAFRRNMASAKTGISPGAVGNMIVDASYKIVLAAYKANKALGKGKNAIREAVKTGLDYLHSHGIEMNEFAYARAVFSDMNKTSAEKTASKETTKPVASEEAKKAKQEIDKVVKENQQLQEKVKKLIAEAKQLSADLEGKKEKPVEKKTEKKEPVTEKKQDKFQDLLDKAVDATDWKKVAEKAGIKASAFTPPPHLIATNAALRLVRKTYNGAKALYEAGKTVKDFDSKKAWDDALDAGVKYLDKHGIKSNRLSLYKTIKEQSVAETEKAGKRKPVTTVTTSKGVTYEVPGDKTEKSLPQVFLDSENKAKAQKLLAQDYKTRVFARKGNTVTVRDLLDDGTIREDSFTFARKPEVASHPFEIAEDGTTVLGGPITEMSKEPTKAKGTPKSEDEKTVHMTFSQAIKHQMEFFGKGLREGRTEINKLKNQFIKDVQTVMKNHPLTPKQTSVILTKLRGTNVFSDKSLKNLTNYVVKIANDADLAEAVDNADTANKKVKGLVGEASRKEKIPFKVFSLIDTQELAEMGVPFLNAHTEIGNRIINSQKPVTDPNYAPVKLEKLKDYLNLVLDSMYYNEIGTMPDASLSLEQKFNEIRNKRAADKAKENADTLGLTEEHIKALAANEELEDVVKSKEKAQAIKDKLIDMATALKSQLEEVPTPEGPRTKRILNSIKKIDPKEMTVKELRDYVEAVDRIVTNDDYTGYTEDIAAIGEGQDSYRILGPRLTNKFHRLTDTAAGWTASIPQAFKSIFGLSENAALVQLNWGHKGITDAAATSKEVVHEFETKLDELKQKLTDQYGKRHNGFDTPSIYRKGIYAHLIKQDVAVDDEVSLQKAKDGIETTIKSYEKKGGVEAKEIARQLRDLYRPFEKAESMSDIHKIMETVDPAGKKAVEFTVDFYNQFKDQIDEYNATTNNAFSQDIKNYSGETNVFAVGSKAKDNTEVTKRGTKPSRIHSSKPYTQSVPVGSALDLNFDIKNIEHIESLVFMLNADPYMRRLQYVANHKDETLKLLGRKEGNSASEDMAEKTFTNLFGSGGMYESFLKASKGEVVGDPLSNIERTVSKMLESAQSLSYYASLSGPTQAIKQMTVLASTYMNLGLVKGATLFSDMTEIARNRPDFKKFISGESVSTRRKVSPLLNAGEIFKGEDLEKLDTSWKQSLARALPELRDKILESKAGGYTIGLRSLLKADATAAEISFLSYYKQSLRKQRIKYTTLENENSLRNTKERQEARAYAKQKVDETQVASNHAELAKILTKKGVFNKLAKATLLPFGSFNLARKQRLATDAKMAVFGDRKQKAEALQDIAAAVAESLLFGAAKAGIRAGTAYLAAGLVRGMFKLKDPEDDEEKKKRDQKENTSFWTDFVSDMIPTTWVAPEPVKQGLETAFSWAAYQVLKSEKPDLTKQEFQDQTGLQLSSPDKSKVGQYAGSYGVIYDKLLQAFESYQHAGKRNTSAESDVYINKNQRKLGYLNALIQFLTIGGITVPADLRNPIQSEWNKQKKFDTFNPKRGEILKP